MRPAYAFLLATPIIGAAAVLKLPVLFGPDGDGVRGQALVASLCAALTAYLAGALPDALLPHQPLMPFAVLLPGSPGLPASSTSSRPERSRLLTNFFHVFSEQSLRDWRSMTKRRNLIAPRDRAWRSLFIALAVLYCGRAGRLAAVASSRGTRPARPTTTSSTGIAAFVVGLGCLVFAWFQTGPSSGRAERPA